MNTTQINTTSIRVLSKCKKILIALELKYKSPSHINIGNINSGIAPRKMLHLRVFSPAFKSNFGDCLFAFITFEVLLHAFAENVKYFKIY